MTKDCWPLDDSDQTTTAIWEQLCRENRACREALFAATVDMYETKSLVGRLPEGSDLALLEPAIRKQLITVRDREVAFASNNLRICALAQYAVESLLLPAWDNTGQFAKALGDLEQCEDELVEGAGLARIALILLHNQYGRDILKRAAAEADQEAKRLWLLYHTLVQALPYLQTTAEELGLALASIQKAIQADLASGLMHEAVETFSERQPEVGEILLGKLSAQASLAMAFIPCIVRGLAKSDFAGTYRQAFRLSRSEDPILVGYAVAALGSLDYHDPAREEYLQKTLDRYADLRQGDSVATARAVTYGYGKLLPYGRDIQEALIELSARSETEIQYELSQVLLLNAKEKHNEEWFRIILMNLAVVRTQDRGTLNNLDGALSFMVHIDSKLAGCFLEKWVVSRDYGREDGQELTKVFGGVFSVLRTNQPTIFEEWVTTWFGADDPRLHRAAADVVEMLTVWQRDLPEQEIRLSRRVLDSMSPEDVGFTIRKILGWVSDSEALATLVFSALQRRPVDPVISELVAEAFVTYVVYNFPRPAIRLLKEHFEKGDEIETEVAQRALGQVESYYSKRSSLPQLREFEPPAQRVRQFQRAEQRMLQGAVYAAAQEESVILQLVTKVPLKAGTSFFSQTDGVITPKTSLNEFEYDADIPRGELIDPVGQAYLRLIWRSETREVEK